MRQRGSEQVKMRSHCLVTKCDKQRVQGHRMCPWYWGRGVFHVFFIRYCQIFTFKEISVHECSSAECSSNIKCHSGSDLLVCLQCLHNVFNTTSAICLLLLFWCSSQQTVSAQKIYTCRIFDEVIQIKSDFYIKFKNIFPHSLICSVLIFVAKTTVFVCVVAARDTTNCSPSCIGQMTA